MNRSERVLLDVKIDKLTRSIEHSSTGEILPTAVLPTSAADLKTITKRQGWLFDWRKESRQPGAQLYKLTAIAQPTLIQGLVSLENRADHVRLNLVESAPFNQGRTKTYLGVPGNLFAYACKLAFEYGHAGNVAFVAKSWLIAHYEASLGAFHFGRHLMILDSLAARRLIDRYFKDFTP